MYWKFEVSLKNLFICIKITIFFSLVTILTSTHSFSYEELLSGHYKRHCELLSLDLKFKKKFPGRHCLFLDDGRLVSADFDGLKMYDRNQQLLWKIEGHFHHMVSLSHDKQYILTMRFILHPTVPKTDIDELLKIDLNGKIVAAQTSMTLFKAVKFDYPHTLKPQAKHTPSLQYELSHFNSIYDVPPNTKSSQGGEFNVGNIIVNTLKGGFFILDKEMKEVLFHFIVKESENHSIHDVQMMNTGEILLFNNINIDSPVGPYSSVDIWDIELKKRIYHYTAPEKQWFFSAFCGGVQVLSEDVFLVSGRLNGIFIINRKLNKLIYSEPYFSAEGENREIYRLQDVKRVDVQNFLKNWNL